MEGNIVVILVVSVVQFFLGLNLNRSNFFRPPKLPQKRDKHIIDFEW